jgi:hypothetical protein
MVEKNPVMPHLIPQVESERGFGFGLLFERIFGKSILPL